MSLEYVIPHKHTRKILCKSKHFPRRFIKENVSGCFFEGLMEFAGVDKAARSKMGVWKMQEWTYRHDLARVDIAGVDKSARYGKGGHCGNGQCGTIWQR